MIILGCIAAVLIGLALMRRPVTEEVTDEGIYYDDDDYFAPVEEAYKEKLRSARFQPGMMYTWEAIEDLLWAYGYTRDEVRAAWNYNYIEICRAGLRAEFDGSLFATDRQGNQLYACHQFDPSADTSDTDRWRRQPTEDERRKAVYR